jgi:hypothetical protein
VWRPARHHSEPEKEELIMQDSLTVEDAVNIVQVLGNDLASDRNEDVQKLVSAAAWLAFHVHGQAEELERERARRHGFGQRDSAMSEGHRLESGVDGGGRRDFVAERGVHAGETLYLLTYNGWHPVRYECALPRGEACLYLPLPGVREDVVFWAPRQARYAWPEELRQMPQ